MNGTVSLPRVAFFAINGVGLGHLSRCLAYARRLVGHAESVFFSLASAVDVIHSMGFEADYFVSEAWAAAPVDVWNRELAIRFGLFLEEVKPAAVVFDGTWPFHGFMDACAIRRVPRRIWSNRALYRSGIPPVPVSESRFDLVIEPGEIGSRLHVERARAPGRRVKTPPVTLLRDSEVLDRAAARRELNLDQNGRYALFSLGYGSLNRVDDVVHGLMREAREAGYRPVWVKAPIATSDLAVPPGVDTLVTYPLVRTMRAFDIFVGAAGYNTCCEVLQSGLPSLLVPNPNASDDQFLRARMLAEVAPVVVSACESGRDRVDAFARLLQARKSATSGTAPPDLTGADAAAQEIRKLIEEPARRWPFQRR